MATTAHCAYCFECLSASLEEREPLSLSQVNKLWIEYSIGSDKGSENNLDVASTEAVYRCRPIRQQTAIRRLQSAASGSSSSSPSSSISLSSPALTNLSSEASKSSSCTSLSSGNQEYREKDQIAEYPLFVTWNTIDRRGHKSLRGCIGTFEAQELDYGLGSYALTAAFDDTRFRPIMASEFPDLECGVTLLTEFETVDDLMDWELGKHGLRISFTYRDQPYGATYLPDVPLEQGWTKEETIMSLIRKAGWMGRRADWRKLDDMHITLYQGRKVNLEYQQWQDWRDWLQK